MFLSFHLQCASQRNSVLSLPFVKDQGSLTRDDVKVVKEIILEESTAKDS